MSDRRPVLLLGATGLIGGHVVEAAKAVPDIRLLALSRREVPLPPGARIEVLVADPSQWEGAIRSLAPQAVICALGTTWRQAGREEAAFRAVDQDLVLKAAKAAGSRGFVLISSVGAEPGSKAFYLRVKGDVEMALSDMGFSRLDILRPGLLRGARSGDVRWAERAANAVSPIANLFLWGRYMKYRAISARSVAAAALWCARQDRPGRFVHEYTGIRTLAAAGSGA